MLDLTAPISCAEVSRPLSTSTGSVVVIQSTLRKPGVGDPTASFDAGDKVILDINVTTPDVYLVGLKDLVRYIAMECTGGQYAKIPASDYSVVIGAGQTTATITVNLTNIVTCYQTNAKLTLLPSWILNTTASTNSRRSISSSSTRSISRRDDETGKHMTMLFEHA